MTVATTKPLLDHGERLKRAYEMHKRVEREGKIDLFCGVCLGGDGGARQQARLFVFFFSSYRTVNVVPFYLAVFPYFVVIIHEKS